MMSMRMSEAKLRVLHSLHQGGGAGSVHSVLRIALGIAARGHDVGLVCPPGTEVAAAAAAGGLTVHPLPLAGANRFTNARRLAALLAAWPPDLVNAHGSRDREAFTWLGLTGRLRMPLVITRHSYPRTARLENMLASRAAAQVIAFSEPVRDMLARRGVATDKMRVIHGGLMLDRIDRAVSPEEHSAWRERIGWEPSRRLVGIVARPKDQDLVLAALPLVRTPIRLVLAGLSGEALTRPLPPIPDRHVVVRLPFLPDVRPLYDLLEVVLHPSRWDAFPQAVLEAMALGKPLIGSNATGNAVIVQDGIDGILVPSTELAAWAEAIDRLLTDRELAGRLGRAAIRRAREDFPFSRTIDRTLACYHEVLGR
jgi:glycosyltransferase involved in cell wall biosynthesis